MSRPQEYQTANHACERSNLQFGPRYLRCVGGEELDWAWVKILNSYSIVEVDFQRMHLCDIFYV